MVIFEDINDRHCSHGCDSPCLTAASRGRFRAQWEMFCAWACARRAAHPRSAAGFVRRGLQRNYDRLNCLLRPGKTVGPEKMPGYLSSLPALREACVRVANDHRAPAHG